VHADAGLFRRLTKMGYKTVYQPKVKVSHNHQRDTFSALLRYSYFYGRVKGMHVKSLHAGMSKRNRILMTFSHPLVYMLMIIPIAFGITASISRFNLREYPRVLLYAPYIFLAKVAYHLGIWQWILHEKHR
jgi:GT2 family glycosyltransferase